jgi:hypothetical protein
VRVAGQDFLVGQLLRTPSLSHRWHSPWTACRRRRVMLSCVDEACEQQLRGMLSGVDIGRVFAESYRAARVVAVPWMVIATARTESKILYTSVKRSR